MYEEQVLKQRESNEKIKPFLYVKEIKKSKEVKRAVKVGL